MEMKISNKISHQDVREAIRKFEAKGGIIHKLPDQLSMNRPVIGHEKYHNYESLASFLAW